MYVATFWGQDAGKERKILGMKPQKIKRGGGKSKGLNLLNGG